MKKLLFAVMLCLSMSATAGDLGAPVEGPHYKPASVGIVFLTIAGSVLLAPASPFVLAAIWAGGFTTAAYVENKK